LGVSDNGTVSGLHVNHLNVTGIASLIANKTNPAISVRVEQRELQDKTIARISVPKSRQLVTTSDGSLWSEEGLNPTRYPRIRTVLPTTSSSSANHHLDSSILQLMVLEDLEAGPLDPLQRLAYPQRHQASWRRTIPAGIGEMTELDAALGLCRSVDGVLQTHCDRAAFWLGTEKLLRDHLPSL
jgi:ATP-dependent DNA helicase RecG